MGDGEMEFTAVTQWEGYLIGVSTEGRRAYQYCPTSVSQSSGEDFCRRGSAPVDENDQAGFGSQGRGEEAAHGGHYGEPGLVTV